MITRIILNYPRHECAMSYRQSCGSFLTITPDGSIEFCDDYDLERVGTLGNIKSHKLIELLKTDQYQAKRTEAIKIVTEKCEKCNIYHLCRCGCMRNDWNHSNYFCDTFKELYPYIKKNIENYLQILRGNNE